ncbi:MAG: Gfo/Idh/MocA family oxidoreductase [Clostridium sp.]|nr:Gfo/Idh/MocA family oxidoreductase [Clostridium sp.]
MSEWKKNGLRWAVLGTGVIAREMAQALRKSGKKLYAVGNRTHARAVAFAEEYGVEKVYGDFNEMFADPEVDAVYITTPHNTHIEFMRKAIRGGKHVLVEKSITLNTSELKEAADLAEKHHVIIGEAMTIYHMPLYGKLKELTGSGGLGRVNMITVNFGSFKEYDMKNRFFNRNLAGGAMLDIGVYALSLIRWFMEPDPERMVTDVRLAPTGVDEQATMLLSNGEGQMAAAALSLHSKQPKRAMISCEKGYIEIMEFPRAQEARITDAVSGEVKTLHIGEYADALKYELEDFESTVRSGENRLHLDYTLDVMELMTRARKAWGLAYPEEL